ncbi:MAG: hypothetical protein WCK47_09340 [bacterium]|nr:hypothetical protein [Candidatus Sumerlaeota bacterium]
MALNSREKKILCLALSIAGAGLIWWLGIGPLYDEYVRLQGQLEIEAKKYRDNREILKTAHKIEDDYRRIEAQFPKDEPGKTPDHAFSEDVVYAVQNILKDRPFTPGTVVPEDMKDVTGYELLTFPVRVTGELQDIATLLKGFDQKGFLIRNITLAHSRGVDNPDLLLEMTLARVVKKEEQTDSTGPRRPGSRRMTPTGGKRP